MKMYFKRSNLFAALVVGLYSLGGVAQDTSSLQSVTVTGTNIKRTEKEGTSPITVITEEDIVRSGATTTLQLMKLVPQMGGDAYNDNPAINSFSRGVANLSLRALGASSTLILLNGRRVAPAAYANPNTGQSVQYNLNTIPVSAIARVEVFRDGASAVYGSDAMGGVINFITKSDYQGMEVSTRVSGNDDGQYRRKGATIAGGSGSLAADGYNVLFTADLGQQDATSFYQGSNDIKQSELAAINYRFNPYSSAYSSSPWFYKQNANGVFSTVAADMVFRTNCDASRQLVGGIAYGIASTSVLSGRTFCNFDANPYYDMQTKGQDANFLTRAQFNLGAGASAFGEFGYGKSERNYRGPGVAIAGTSAVSNWQVGGPAQSFQALLPVGHPDNPYSSSRAALYYRFEDTPTGTDTVNQQYRVLAGLKGMAGDWDWETAVLWNRAESSNTNKGQLYLPVLRQLLTGRSIASIAADPNISVPFTTLGVAQILQYDAKASTQFGALPGGPLGFAFGSEVRTELTQMIPDAVHAAGNIYGYSTQKIDSSRDVQSGFFELRAPFQKDFEMDFAGRADKYPGLATNFVPKVGAKWTVNDTLAFRGTSSRGFRAPALSQSAPGATQFFTSVTDTLRCPDGVNPAPGGLAADCKPTSVSGISGGNPNLVPENSRGTSFGFIFSPSKNAELLLDWYRIRQENQIALGSAQSIVDNPSRYAAGSLVRDPNPATWIKDSNGVPIPDSGPLISVTAPWINKGSTEVEGIDLELKLQTKLDNVGDLNSSLKAGYVLAYRAATLPGDVEANVAGRQGGLSDWATSTGAVPALKLELSSALVSGSHTFTGAVHFVGSVDLNRYTDGTKVYDFATCQYGGPAAPGVTGRNILGTAPNSYIDFYPDCKIPAWTTLDVGYSYSGFKDLTLNFLVANITDQPAPYAPTTSAVSEGYNAGLHNPYGRYYTFSAKYVFK
jgi:iron complex outermembrane receptor protein